MKILHLDTSINGEQSVSRRVAGRVVRSLQMANPDAEVIYRDLAATPLPHLTLAEFGTDASLATLAEFQTADVVVIGTGMYNFTVPSQLKAWIDRILVAGQTFRYTDSGPEGLAGGKRVIVALARGGFYAEHTPSAGLEHAETYLRGVFAFIGIGDVHVISIDGLAMPESRDGAIAHAERQVDEAVA